MERNHSLARYQARIDTLDLLPDFLIVPPQNLTSKAHPTQE